MSNKQKELCYKFSKVPMLKVQEPVLMDVSQELEKLLAVKKVKKKRIVESMYEETRTARLKSAKTKIVPEPIYFPPAIVQDFQKFSQYSTNSEMSRFQERDIRKRIEARGLEEQYSHVVNDYIKEVKLEYIKIVHYAGMNLKIKSCHPEGKFTLAPYKFVGKTNRFNDFLAIRKCFKMKWILHYPIVREVHSECVLNLPTQLFKLHFNHVLSVGELKSGFKEYLETAEAFIYEFYRKILTITEKVDEFVNSHYCFKVLTGLLTLHISECIIYTIQYLIDFTAAKEPEPYIFLEVSFTSELTLNPTPEELITIYSNFIDNILNIRNEVYDLESYKKRGYKRKNINLYITEEFVRNSKEEIKKNINLHFEPILDYLNTINNNICEVYKDLYSDEFLDSIVDVVFEEGCKKINYYRKYLNKVMFIPDYEFFRIAKLSFINYKRELHKALNKNIDLIFGKLAYQHFWEINDLCETFEHIKMRALRVPETTEELVETGKYMNRIKNEYLETLEQRVGESLHALCKIIDLGIMTKEHLDLNCKSIQWLTDILPVIEEYSASFDTLKYDAEEKLQKVVEEVGEMIQKVFPLLTLLDEMDNIAKANDYLNFITLHMQKIKEVEEQIEWINQEEGTLSFPKSTYSEYEELKNYIYPFHHLLHLCMEVKQKVSAWQDGPFENLKYEYTKHMVEKFHKELTAIYKTCRQKLRQAQDENLAVRFKGTVDDPDMLNWPAPLKLCGTALKLIEDFEPAVEVMKIICNKCLRKRHWQAMSEIAGVDVTPNAGTTLRKIMLVNFFSKMEEYEIISVGASKEKLLLDQLNKLKEEWDDVKFTVCKHKEYDLRVLTHLDEIETVITDQTTIIFNMRGSVFVKPYEKEVREFHKILITISKTIVHWYKVQNILIKLYPILSLKELNLIIPKETELLRNIIGIYNNSIDLIINEVKVIKIVSETNLTNDLESCIGNLEIVFKGVNLYLDGVRKTFPRFYFISNDEFIKALSNPKTILLSELFLNKLFQGIHCLEIEDNEIVGIISKHSEILKITNPIPIQSSLETLFKKVETEMKSTLKNEILEYCHNFKTEFTDAFTKYSEQTLKVASYCFWTENIEMALCLKSHTNLKIQFDNLEISIEEKILLVKKNLNNNQRFKLRNIIVSEIHIKDLIKQIIDSKIISINNFEWESHFKYFLKNGSLKIIMMHSTTEFMYEYMGNYHYTITPNTERCIRMLVNTYFMNYCGIINGKSDTGKFECIKILASIFGNYLLKFVCSEELSNAIIERILKGTLLCGSWLCFENFTTLKLTAISAISEYLFNIQLAKTEMLEQCLIGGMPVILKKSCFINICTINNSYVNLPESVRKFFRISTILKPDTKKIAEISLFSQGFKSATILAKKMSTVIDFLDDILSMKQNYYRGLTKYMRILEESEKYKLENIYLNEEDIIFLAVNKVLSQAVPNESYNEFHYVLHNAFPNSYLIVEKTNLEENIKLVCDEENLQVFPEFSSKICELYETILKEKSVILVGSAASSKTTIIKICKKLFEIQDNELFNLYFISPNCFDHKKLFGFFTNDQEWFDGVVTKLCRKNETESSKNIIIFDGDINPTWIEAIKPVIQDQKLYLDSGEILQLGQSHKVLFEVDKLDNCSPSVISQSTLIYINKKSSNWSAVISSWTATCNSSWMQGHRKQINDIFCWIIPACLECVCKNCKQICNLSEINLVNNMVALTTLILDDVCAGNKKEEDLKNIYTWIQATIIQAGVIGLGSVLDKSSRQKFDEFYRQLWRGQNPVYPYPKHFGKLEVGIPQEGLIYDYRYIYKQRGNWKLYQDLLKFEKIVQSPYMQEFLVPTVDTMRYNHILDLFTKNHLPVLLVGPSNTGKTILLENTLRNKLNEEDYDISYVNFNLYSDAVKTQHNILLKLNKRKGGVYTPTVGKNLIMFIDNLNQISSDSYGNFSCTELIRQYLDHKVLYDYTTFDEIFISDLNLLSAMGTPEGNKKELNLRFLRHFHVFGCNAFSPENITKIFSNVLIHIWRRNGFPGDTITIINQIIDGTYTVYKNIIKRFRPTLNRPYFCFNINNFGEIIKGCTLLKKETYDSNKKICLKLWIHENMKVFGDRLSSLENASLENEVKEAMSAHFNESLEDLAETSFQKITLSTIHDRDKYEEVDPKQILEILEDQLNKYNVFNDLKLNVVYFEYALEKIFKISRILSLASGNALFLGSSGLGRISLTKLLSYIYEYKLFQPTITKDYTIEDWKCELKKVLKEAGAIEHKTVFLVNERDLIKDEFLQYIEQLLQTGDIYDIFNTEEKQEILELSRLSAQGGNRNLDISSTSVFLHFNNCCRRNLHLILCLSPNAKPLRTRLKIFPTLLNCHFIFWDDWPDEALQNVAEILTADLKLEDEAKTNSINAFIYFHRQFQMISKQSPHTLPTHLRISPICFIHLVELFTELFTEEKLYISDKIKSFSQGLSKLSYAANQILAMEKVLAEYKPQLAEMTAKAIEMTEQIALETIEVERASDLVREDEKIAAQQAIVAQNLKSECEAELAQAIPILEDAISALNTLKPSDITLVKSMKNPPDAIKLVMAAVCVIKDVKPDRIPDPSTGRKSLDYWGPSKRILGDMNFLQTLKDFDKDNIKAEIMVKIRKEFLPHKDFKPHIVAKASSAAEGLCKWIIAMDMYDKVAKEVAPKKEKLGKAEKEYADTLEILNQKKEEVKRIEEKLAALNALLEDANRKQVKLQKEVDLCNKKLSSAQTLIGSLDEEQVRWTEAVKKLEKQNELALGNVLLTAGIVVYLSPLKYVIRNEIKNNWRQYISNCLSCSNNFSINQSFSSKFKIEARKQGILLRDDFFLENILMYDFSKQYSIFLDPDYQADSWIRKSEKGNNLTVTTFSHENYLDKLKDCVIFGTPILIHKIKDNIPACLYHFISRYRYNKDGEIFSSINNETIKLHKHFRIYLVSNTAEPVFLPELLSKVTLIDFSISEDYLTKHLLRILTEFEKPELKKNKKEIYAKKNKYQKEITKSENCVLQTLCESQTDILEDEESIKILEEYKEILKKLRKKFDESIKAEQVIFQFTDKYKTVAEFTTNIYCYVSKLKYLNHFYQFSFEWFIYLYCQSIHNAEKSKNIPERCNNIIRKFIFEISKKVSYSLFQKDKYPCVLLMVIFILKHKKVITNDEVIVFTSSFISSIINWSTLKRLEQIPVFYNFCSSFRENFITWKTYMETESYMKIPEPWQSKLNPFQKLILIKMFKPRYLYISMKNLVISELGAKFLDNFSYNFNEIFNESFSLSPTLLISKNGYDFLDDLYSLIKTKQLFHTFRSISLSEQLYISTDALIEEAQEKGYWLLFQNCHLDKTWLENLEKKLETMNYENTNQNFRLWLTLEPFQNIPNSILQNSLKLVFDSSGSFKYNLEKYFKRNYVSDYFFNGCPGKKEVFTKLLFGLISFHSCLRERNYYDNILWKIPYSVDENDIKVSAKLLKITLTNQKNNSDVDIIKLFNIIGKYQYCSKFDNSNDFQFIITILNDFINTDIIKNKSYCFSDIEEYYFPLKCDYRDYAKVISNYPEPDIPEIFGISQEFYGIRSIINANDVIETVSNIFIAKTKRTIEDNPVNIIDTINDLIKSLPDKLEINFQTDIILKYEFKIYNSFLEIIIESLLVLKKSLEGYIIISDKNEINAKDILNLRVPNSWEKISVYSSKESLSEFIKLFKEKMDYLKDFQPDQKCIWLAAFTSPKALLCKLKLDLSLKSGIPYEHFGFFNKVLHNLDEIPEIYRIVTGLFIANAQWDKQSKSFCEILSKIYNIAPPILFIPMNILNSEYSKFYRLSLYQSYDLNSFICTINLPSFPMKTHWIKRGVKFFCHASNPVNKYDSHINETFVPLLKS